MKMPSPKAMPHLLVAAALLGLALPACSVSFNAGTKSSSSPSSRKSPPKKGTKSQPKPVKKPAPAPSGHAVASPLVGTFYRSPSPEEGPFVEVGQLVAPGDSSELGQQPRCRGPGGSPR